MVHVSVHAPPVRVVVWVVVALVLAVSLVDLGSVVLTRMRVADDLEAAGLAGATAIQGRPVSGETAQAAYAAAATRLDDGEEIDTTTFAVGPDGGVRLTVTATAPTLVFKHLGFLDDVTEVEDTYEQPRIGY